MKRSCITCVYLTVTLCLIAHGQTAEELKNDILSYRSRIRHGEVQIKTSSENKHKEFEYDKRDSTISIAFDGNDLHVARQLKDYRDGKLKGTFSDQAVITRDRYIYDEIGKMHVAVNQGAITDRSDLSQVVLSLDFHPRDVGFILQPMVVWPRFGLEDALAWLNKVESIEQGQIEGQSVLIAKIISGKGPENGEWTIWLCPEKGYGILKSDFHTPTLDRKVRAVYEQVPGGFWYPKTIMYDQLVDGIVVEHEATEISADFTKIPDKHTFELAGLNLDVGRRVRDSGKHMIWDGTKLIAERAEPTSIPLDTEGRPHSNKRYFLWANAIVFSVLACVLIFRWFGRK